MTDQLELSAQIRRELKNPAVAVVGLVLYGGAAIVLLLFWFTDLRSVLLPFVGPGTAFILIGFIVFLSIRARNRMNKEKIR